MPYQGSEMRKRLQKKSFDSVQCNTTVVPCLYESLRVPFGYCLNNDSPPGGLVSNQFYLVLWIYGLRKKSDPIEYNLGRTKAGLVYFFSQPFLTVILVGVDTFRSGPAFVVEIKEYVLQIVGNSKQLSKTQP